MIPTFVRWQWITSRVWCVWKSKSKLLACKIQILGFYFSLGGIHYRLHFRSCTRRAENRYVVVSRSSVPCWLYNDSCQLAMRKLTIRVSNRIVLDITSLTNWAVVGHGALTIQIAYRSIKIFSQSLKYN